MARNNLSSATVSIIAKERLQWGSEQTTLIRGYLPLLPLTAEKKPLIGKRLFDLIFSAIVLLFLSPLFILIALGIKCSSKGGIFFSQPRLGLTGKIFSCIKFRTMDEEAEAKLVLILRNNPQLKKEWEEKQKLSVDPRVFAFGRFLRKTSLDELPQFWNVLKGDLSVVGPRPYMINQRAQLGALAPKILSIRPGITGLWQTSGRSSTSFQKRILLDAEYVDKASFHFDLKLILKTLPALLSSANAY